MINAKIQINNISNSDANLAGLTVREILVGLTWAFYVVLKINIALGFDNMKT